MKKSVLLLLLQLFVSGVTAGKDIVARRDFVPQQESLPVIMGYSYWPLFSSNNITHPGIKSYPVYDDICKEPLFRNSALVYVNYTTTVPNGTIDIKKLFSPAHLQAFESNLKNNVPFFIRFCGTRHPHMLNSSYAQDLQGYKIWKKKYPNFMGFEQSEWDNELVMMDYWFSQTKDVPKRLELQKTYPSPTTREAAQERSQKIYGLVRNFYFGDVEKLNFMRAGWCFDPLSAAFGANMLCLETTNTSSGEYLSYRWQISVAFTRGTARQFSIPWYWYIANFYNGFDSNGQWKNNYYRNYYTNQGIYGPEKGMSRSLLKRNFYLAYLSGASFLELENWTCLILKMDKQKNKIVYSPIGDDYKEFYNFTQKNPDRGTAYTPVALLVPLSQGYPNWGGCAWERFSYEKRDYMIDAFMYTIIPGFEKYKNMKTGVEGALHNSLYGDIYDVLTPDVPQNNFFSALSRYKVAVMLGKYNTNQEFAAKLMGYVKNGGTIILNASQLNAHYPSSFTGLVALGKNISSGKNAHSFIDGKTFSLDTTYNLLLFKQNGAEVLIEDENKNPLAYIHNFGKGKVIITTPEYMVPALKKESFAELASGKQKFPLIAHLMERITAETLPLKVEGDIQYGLNRTKDGWWLYLINNKGVRKFVDTPQTIDLSKRVQVKITLSKIPSARIKDLISGEEISGNDTFELQVNPGDFRLLKITEAAK